ncbi:MAG: adaptor protein MecA [Clostridiales bacterium]|nr:adaptor protein MecA [Clostridiales bacterium]
MKIEKLNDNQIRCTLTNDDLDARHIKLSELAYGTEKTRALFQDMMTQASVDLGFEADDIPLMVEAIPLSSEKIVLIITKIESPDELDTRFSEFSEIFEDDADPGTGDDLFESEPDFPDDLADLLSELRKEFFESGALPDSSARQPDPANQVCLFVFSDMDSAVRAARAVASFYQGSSSLYRDTAADEYLLFLYRGKHTTMEFSRIVHTMTAWLEKRRCTPATAACYQEHCRPILARHAIDTLAQIIE